MIKQLKSLFKFGIVVFVLISAAVGYGIGFEIENDFSVTHFLIFLLGTFLISSGSLALNQVQEVDKDALMPRTQSRPIVTGFFSKRFALGLSLTHILLGSLLLYFFSSKISAYLGLLTIFLYNGLYTLHWKPRFVFAAVPGAIPGALPVTMGFGAVNENIFSSESVYLFLIMFLWQMPHFWTLALKFKNDYGKGAFPVLPVALGKQRTLIHISMYVICYCFVALMSPLFIDAYILYYILVVPFALKVIWEFIKFVKSQEEKAWLYFFLWTNFSMIAFLFAPLIGKWSPLISTLY